MYGESESPSSLMSNYTVLESIRQHLLEDDDPFSDINSSGSVSTVDSLWNNINQFSAATATADHIMTSPAFISFEAAAGAHDDKMTHKAPPKWRNYKGVSFEAAHDDELRHTAPPKGRNYKGVRRRPWR
ncbi:hypothetical protein Tsubulata_043148 [Turnera subulata]|uniref:AP2/ERF domain-containing protein n=1 Tax=Turnera subulata TaxID=218843 RepID=A0A9Q0JF26_9ROSI|nr:hypothetical protein Tsubulata_043148 [Turnera subulata]